jgi:cobalt-zinc-cadmium efflux system outer membrane protein
MDSRFALAPLCVVCSFATTTAEEVGAPISRLPAFTNKADVSEVIPLPPVAAAADGLTLAHVENLALANNPTLLHANARVLAAQGRRVQSGLYPNPEVGYAASEIGDDGRAGQQGAFVAQEFVRGQKLKLSQQVASQEIRQAIRELEAQRMRVLNDARREFYSVLVAQESVRVTEELVAIAEKAVSVSGELLEAQESGRVDLLQASVELESVRIGLTNAKLRYQSAWRRLAAVAGVPGMAPATAMGDLRVLPVNLTWDEELSRILGSSPQIAAARTGVARSRWAVRRAHAEPIPNIDVQTSVQYDNSTGYTLAGLQVGIPLPLYNRNQGGIREANAELVAATAEVGRVELALQEQLATVFERYARAQNQVEKYSKEILPTAKRSLELVNLGYQSGEFGYVTLLTSQRTFSMANLSYLSALDEMWSSAIEIDSLLLANSLQNPPLTGVP